MGVNKKQEGKPHSETERGVPRGIHATRRLREDDQVQEACKLLVVSSSVEVHPCDRGHFQLTGRQHRFTRGLNVQYRVKKYRILKNILVYLRREVAIIKVDGEEC